MKNSKFLQVYKQLIFQQLEATNEDLNSDYLVLFISEGPDMPIQELNVDQITQNLRNPNWKNLYKNLDPYDNNDNFNDFEKLLCFTADGQFLRSLQEDSKTLTNELKKIQTYLYVLKDYAIKHVYVGSQHGSQYVLLFLPLNDISAIKSVISSLFDVIGIYSAAPTFQLKNIMMKKIKQYIISKNEKALEFSNEQQNLFRKFGCYDMSLLKKDSTWDLANTIQFYAEGNPVLIM